MLMVRRLGKRQLVYLFVLLLAGSCTFYTLLLRQFLYAREMDECARKVEMYRAREAKSRVYPRTMREIIEDYRATRCEPIEEDILHLKPMVNRHLLSYRYLIEPSNAARFCNDSTFLVMFILSPPSETEVRRKIRETWAHPDNIFHPSLVEGLNEPFRSAFKDSALRRRFGVRTVFVLGTDERTAAMNAENTAEDHDEEALKNFDAASPATDTTDNPFLETSDSESQWSIENSLRTAKHRFQNAAFRIKPGVLPGSTVVKPLDATIRLESQLFNDIVQVSFNDSYANLTLKVLLASKWVVARCPSARYAMKIDTDTLPNIPAIVASLIERDLSGSRVAALYYPSFYSASTSRKDKDTADDEQRTLLRHFASIVDQFHAALARECTASSNGLALSQSEERSVAQTRSTHDSRYAMVVEHIHRDQRAFGAERAIGSPTSATASRSRCDRSMAEFYAAFYSPTVVGYRYDMSEVFRSGRWAISKDSLPFDVYPQYLAGTGYVMTVAALHELFTVALHFRYFISIEDAYINGFLGSAIRIRKFHDSRYSPIRSFRPFVCTFVRGARLTATDFDQHELVQFWRYSTDSNTHC